MSVRDRTLDAEQKGRLEEYLSRYPVPAAVLIKSWPSLRDRWLDADRTYDELRAECLYAAVLAAGAWSDGGGRDGRRCSFDSYVALNCRWQVLRVLAVRVRVVRTMRPRLVKVEGRWEDELDLVPSRPGKPTNWYGGLWDLVRPVLRDRPARILAMRYGFCGEDAASLDKVGREVGVCRERVRQIEANACRKLKDKIEAAAAAHRLDADSYLKLVC